MPRLSEKDKFASARCRIAPDLVAANKMSQVRLASEKLCMVLVPSVAFITPLLIDFRYAILTLVIVFFFTVFLALIFDAIYIIFEQIGAIPADVTLLQNSHDFQNDPNNCGIIDTIEEGVRLVNQKKAEESFRITPEDLRQVFPSQIIATALLMAIPALVALSIRYLLKF